MATFSTLGVGTGTDLNSILTKLMDVERAPIKALDTKISSTNTKISLYGTLQSKLDALSSAADTLRFPSRLSVQTAKADDESVASAKADWLASAGSYSLEVIGLAATQKSSSSGYTAGTQFTAGTITFTVGDPAGTTTDHVIDLSTGGPYSLSDIRNQINQAGAGVKATIVTDSDSKEHLVLTSTSSGKVGTFSVATTMTASGGQASLATLTNVTTAADAQIKLDGITLKSSSNQFTSAVPGVTFTAKTVGTTTVTVDADPSKLSSALKTFVDSYNAVVSLVKSNSGYDIDKKVAGAFNADAAARSVLSSLTSARTTVPTELASATLKNLYEVGISVDRDGQMTLDSAKLSQASASSVNAVVTLAQAYGTAFATTISGLKSSTGTLNNRVTALDAQATSYQKQREALEIRVSTIEAGYRKQFSALDKMISSMQQTSSYLAQQLAGLSNR